jgi:hypothetical protein
MGAGPLRRRSKRLAHLGSLKVLMGIGGAIWRRLRERRRLSVRIQASRRDARERQTAKARREEDKPAGGLAAA